MKIIVNDNRKILGLQDEFSKLFPFLKLEFYSKSSDKKGGWKNKAQEASSKTLGECRIMHNKSTIIITPKITIDELTQIFSDAYGLSVRILRKSGKAWIEASMSGGWTLEEQNNQGRDLCLNNE